MKKYFTHLLTLVACLAWSATASAQYSATVESYPVTDYSTKMATFPLDEVTSKLGTDAATLLPILTAWQDAEEVTEDYFFLQDPNDGTLTANHTADGGGFYLNLDGTLGSWGEENSRWFVYPTWDEEENVFAIAVGQHSDRCVAGDESKATFVLKYEDKQVSFEITYKVIEKPVVEIPEAVTDISKLNIVGSQVVEVEQEPRTNFAADAVEIDLTGVAALLGTTDDVIAAALADIAYTTSFESVDEIPMKTDVLTKEASATAPGWWYAQVWDTELQALGSEVARSGYGDACSFYFEALAYDAESHTLKGNLGQYPSHLNTGDVLTANIYLIFGEKAYQLTIQLTIGEKSVTKLEDMTEVGSADATAEFEATDGYDGADIYLDLEAILAALGVESINDVTIMVNDEGGLAISNTANNGGSWLNAEGLITGWGSGSTLYFEPEMVKNEETEDEVADWSQVYVGQYPNALEPSSEYHFAFYFVAGEKYYTVNVTIKTTESEEPIGEEVPQSEWKSVAAKTVNIQVVPLNDYTVEMKYYYDAAEVAELLGTSKPTLYALAVPNEEVPEADKYTNGYTCTPYPGFWMNRDGYVTNWSSTESPWGATFDINAAEVTFYQYPDFTDNVVGKVYKAPMYLVNTYTGDMVTFNITLTFVSEIVEVETVGETELPLSVVTGESETKLDITEVLEALGFETAYDLINSNQGLTYMLADGTFSSGSRAEDGVMLTEKGVLDESEGYVDSKIYVRIEENGDNGITIITEGIDFAEGDRIEAKIGFQNEGKRYIFNIIFLDPVAYDGVGNLKMNTKDAPVYDLSGRRVNNPAQRGIYIQAGRKVAVK